MYCPRGTLVEPSEVSQKGILGTEWDLQTGGRVTLYGVPTNTREGSLRQYQAQKMTQETCLVSRILSFEGFWRYERRG